MITAISTVWAERLRACQAAVLQHDQCMEGDLDHIIRTFAFDSQRFDSFCRPLFTVICLLKPIVMMLITIGEDNRDKEQQNRALKVLRALNLKFIVNMGLAADYAETGLRLIREFDALSKDPASSRVLLDAWSYKMKRLFKEGGIGQVPDNAIGQTATQIALQQATALGNFVTCGDMTINFVDESPTMVLAGGGTSIQAHY